MNKFTLGVETSSNTGSLALFDSNKSYALIDALQWTKAKSHSEVITGNLLELLKKNNLEKKSISSVACGVGPGSFTGIRIGLSFAKSISFAFDVGLATFDSLSVLAHGVDSPQRPILTMMNAFKNMVYSSLYTLKDGQLQCLVPPFSCRPENLQNQLEKSKLNLNDFGPITCVGDGFELYQEEISPQLKSSILSAGNYNLYPKAQTLGHLLRLNNENTVFKSWELANPLYIRASEAEEKLRDGSLKPVTEI